MLISTVWVGTPTLMSVDSLSSELKGVQWWDYHKRPRVLARLSAMDSASHHPSSYVDWMGQGGRGLCLHLRFFSMPLVGQEGKGTPLDK